MNDMLVYLKEVLKSQTSVTIHLNAGNSICISKIAEIYNNNWIRVLQIDGQQQYLVNMKYVEHVTF